jgi:hypothetical protein
MTTSATTDPWATNDHDPLSNTEHNPAPHPKTLTVKSISGAVIAEYPDFTPGTPVRVLPPIISNASPTTGRIVEDNWSFAGTTRHPEYATIRHDRDRVTIAVERRRLQQRPAK